MPTNFRSVKNYVVDPMHVKIPIQEYLVDKSAQECLKKLTKILIDKRITHYTCLCNYFAVFVSDELINCKNNPVMSAFTGVNSLDKFKALNLPISQLTKTKDGAEQFPDFSAVKNNCKESVFCEISL